MGDLKWLGAIKERERTTKDEAQTLKINGLSGKCQGLLELFFDLFLLSYKPIAESDISLFSTYKSSLATGLECLKDSL